MNSGRRSNRAPGSRSVAAVGDHYRASAETSQAPRHRSRRRWAAGQRGSHWPVAWRWRWLRTQPGSL